jgi:hypothetical protein
MYHQIDERAQAVHLLRRQPFQHHLHQRKLVDGATDLPRMPILLIQDLKPLPQLLQQLLQLHPQLRRLFLLFLLCLLQLSLHAKGWSLIVSGRLLSMPISGLEILLLAPPQCLKVRCWRPMILLQARKLPHCNKRSDRTLCVWYPA